LVYVLFSDLGVSVIGDNITKEELVHDLWQWRGLAEGKLKPCVPCSTLSSQVTSHAN
jgi:hypothetical protein